MLYYKGQFKKFSEGFSKHMQLAGLVTGDCVFSFFFFQMIEIQDAYYFNIPEK